MLKAQQCKIGLSLQAAENVPELVQGDCLHLRQVLINIIDNAIKFTEKGKVEVFVEVTSTQQASSELKFTVVDTRMGMIAEEVNKLFQPFVQLDDYSTANI